jgi:hypothetical protein
LARYSVVGEHGWNEQVNLRCSELVRMRNALRFLAFLGKKEIANNNDNEIRRV